MGPKVPAAFSGNRGCAQNGGLVPKAGITGAPAYSDTVRLVASRGSSSISMRME